MERTPAADGVANEAATVGGVPGWWCRPAEAQADAAILYLHGGGYGVGSAQAYRNFVGQIAARARIAAFVADYRLAPERPFPAAVEDAEAAYRGLARMGVERIAIVGDSAGGGLALSTAVRLSREAPGGDVRPIAVVALSPWTDLALTGESLTTRAKHDPLLTRAILDAAAKHYLGAADLRTPEASPLFADLAGLPPVLLHVGDDEILLDDARRIARRLREAGGSSELHVWRGMVHVFPANVALLHAAREALDIVGEFLRRAVGR
jgi:acetyl esterase/lipase